MSTMLKPCPFCGKDPTVDRSEWYNPDTGKADHRFRVICPGCGASQTLADSHEAAAKIWNQRAAARNDKAEADTVTLALSKYEMIVSERATLMGQVSTLIGRINEMTRSLQRGEAVSDK